MQTPQSVSELLDICAHLNDLEMTVHIGTEVDINHELCL
jgi:hypothetical protein